MPAETRTLAVARIAARGPRIAFLACAGLLALAGLRGVIAPPVTLPAKAKLVGAAPTGVGPFAEAYAREYLSWTPDSVGQREQRLVPFLADGLDPDGGLAPVPGTTQRVTWTSAAAPRAAAPGTWVVTIVAGLADGTRTTLAVPVHARAGAMAVADYPALTAITARATQARAPAWNTPVDDGELARVVERALRNYLAGRAGDLQADLAPGTRVVTPEQTTRLISIDELDWQQPGRLVAALVAAELPDRARLRLRLHLAVRRDGRWFVAGLDPTTPPTQGAPR